MTKKITACLAVCLFSGTLFADGISLAISLPGDTFIRGANIPVEGLTVTMTITNGTGAALLLPKPEIHPLAAPAMAAKATIKPVGEKADKAEPIPVISGMEKSYMPEAVETLRIETGKTVDVTLNVGKFYLIRRAGKYEMTITYRGVESNAVQFTVLPLRRLEIPGDLILKRINDIEWGDPNYDDMFYVAQSARAWGEIYLVQRVGIKADYPLVINTVGALAAGAMPEMTMPAPRVFILVYPEKTGTGWVVAKIDCSVDPFKPVYKHVTTEEKPDPNAVLAEAK